MKALVLYRAEQSIWFRESALMFKNFHPDSEKIVKPIKGKREFLAKLDNPSNQKLDVFCYIGHGWPDRLRLGGNDIDIKKTDIPELKRRLEKACNKNAALVFYCCLAGELNNSFLHTLSLNLLPGKSFRVYGHSGIQDAVRSPEITFFRPGGHGANLIDITLGKLAKLATFRKAWKQAIWDVKDGLWATFFLKSRKELRRYILRQPLKAATEKNKELMKTVGWESDLTRIRLFFKISSDDPLDLADAIINWQLDQFQGKGKVDGILDATSWSRLRNQMANPPK